MADLKLGRLPDRTSVKIAITVGPQLNRALRIYAALYRETYGEAESVAQLIPYMLASFLDSDRGFAKARKEKETAGPSPSVIDVAERPTPRKRTPAASSTTET